MHSKAIEIYVFLFVFLIVVAVFLGQPYFEMKSFNRCTGSNASYVDALFTQLRIENCKKGE